MGIEKFRFDGKRALVVGGATGMGNAAAVLLDELGATVEIADVREPATPVGSFSELDLRDRSAIDRLVDGMDRLDVVLSCAGVSDGMAGLPQINFIGHRHLLDRAIERGVLGEGSSVGMIASIGGAAWLKHLDDVDAFLGIPDYDDAVAWSEQNAEKANYVFFKWAMIVYAARQAALLASKRIRFNCIAPGPTMTPLMAATPGWQGFEQMFGDLMGRPGATSEEQAYPLVFLCSDAAGYVSGQCLNIDAGFITGIQTSAIDTPMGAMLLA